MARDQRQVAGVAIEERVKELRIGGVGQLVQGIDEDQESALGDQETEIRIGQLDTAAAQRIEDKILHRTAGQHMGAQIDQQGRRALPFRKRVPTKCSR